MIVWRVKEIRTPVSVARCPYLSWLMLVYKRHRKNVSAPWFQRSTNLFECLGRIVDMFQDVLGDDNVKRPIIERLLLKVFVPKVSNHAAEFMVWMVLRCHIVRAAFPKSRTCSSSRR